MLPVPLALDLRIAHERWGVQLAQSTFHFRRAAFSSQLKSKVGHILAKAAALRFNLNIDGVPIVSRSHTHPSHLYAGDFPRST